MESEVLPERIRIGEGIFLGRACDSALLTIILSIMKTNVFAQKILTAGLGFMLAGGCAQSQRTPGKGAPNFELTDLSGQKVSLAQHKGHVVMICFWAVG